MKQLTKVRFTEHYWGYGLVWYIIFAWYDLWIGAYWDREFKKLYICLIPTFAIVIRINKI